MKLKLPPWSRSGWGVVKKYQYVLLVALVGAVLLLIPSGEKPAETAAPEEGQQFRLEELEKRLEQALGQIEGAGEVHAVLTLKSGSRQVQEVVPLQTLAPEYQGALIVCQGGGDPAVRLNILQAVSALTGLGADKISICKSG